MKEIARLLASAAVVRNACDFDLLVFLYRHPRTLVTSEQLAAFVGYPLNQIAESLEALIASGLLSRTQNPLHAARLYLLQIDGPQGNGLRMLLELTSTREGRSLVIESLRAKQGQSDSALEQAKRRVLKIA